MGIFVCGARPFEKQVTSPLPLPAAPLVIVSQVALLVGVTIRHRQGSAYYTSGIKASWNAEASIA